MALGTSAGLASSCSRRNGAGFTYGFGGTTSSISRGGGALRGTVGGCSLMPFMMVGSTWWVGGEFDLGRGPKEGAVEDAGEGDRRLGVIGGKDALGMLNDRPRPRLTSLRARLVSTVNLVAPVVLRCRTVSPVHTEDKLVDRDSCGHTHRSEDPIDGVSLGDQTKAAASLQVIEPRSGPLELLLSEVCEDRLREGGPRGCWGSARCRRGPRRCSGTRH